jgi:hypothetical protein
MTEVHDDASRWPDKGWQLAPVTGPTWPTTGPIPTIERLAVMTGAFVNRACQLMSMVLEAPTTSCLMVPASVSASTHPSDLQDTLRASGMAGTARLVSRSVKKNVLATGHRIGMGEDNAFKRRVWTVPRMVTPASAGQTVPITDRTPPAQTWVIDNVLENARKSTDEPILRTKRKALTLASPAGAAIWMLMVSPARYGPSASIRVMVMYISPSVWRQGWLARPSTRSVDPLRPGDPAQVSETLTVTFMVAQKVALVHRPYPATSDAPGSLSHKDMARVCPEPSTVICATTPVRSVRGHPRWSATVKSTPKPRRLQRPG